MNEPLPDCAFALGMPVPVGTGWLAALSEALAQEDGIELGVASRVAGVEATTITLRGVQHFTVPVPQKGFALLRPTTDILQRYQQIGDRFSPDLVHVQGTEWYGGMVTVDNRMGRPAIVSLQGLIDYHRRHLLGDLGFLDILKSRTLREWILFSGLWKQQVQWDRRATVEGEIIRGHQAFVGRTLWDRAHLRRMNPNAAYYHCHEAVRREFRGRQWRLPYADRYTIFAPSASYPLKGFHVLLRAVAVLRREFPSVKVRVPLARFISPPGMKGAYVRMKRDGYSNYLAALIDSLDIAGHITALGQLSGEEMAAEMGRSHVFALTSFVENSPNTMAEALTLGVPAVVSLAGGVPSLIVEGQNALGFPPGDEAVLAEQIRRIFTDDDLALRLSKAGRETAKSRHLPGPIAQRMVAIYDAVIRGDCPGYLELPFDKGNRS